MGSARRRRSRPAQRAALPWRWLAVGGALAAVAVVALVLAGNVLRGGPPASPPVTGTPTPTVAPLPNAITVIEYLDYQ
ncbi:MAG: hypothetical protein HY683_06980 [Chloroflexi bacterium]|nr:hypothetical protein [Chloroflexota bacterium]